MPLVEDGARGRGSRHVDADAAGGGGHRVFLLCDTDKAQLAVLPKESTSYSVTKLINIIHHLF